MALPCWISDSQNWGDRWGPTRPATERFETTDASAPATPLRGVCAHTQQTDSECSLSHYCSF